MCQNKWHDDDDYDDDDDESFSQRHLTWNVERKNQTVRERTA